MTDFHSLTPAEGDLTDEELQALASRLVKIHWDNYGCTYDVLPFARAVIAADRTRHPTPPSLKQQALKTVSEMAACMKAGFVPKRSDLDTIRSALEQLPD